MYISIYIHLKHRNIEKFVSSSAQLMNTPTKSGIWYFLLPTLEENHREYVKNYLTEKNISSRETFFVISSRGYSPK